jgi:hypothetical protein
MALQVVSGINSCGTSSGIWKRGIITGTMFRWRCSMRSQCRLCPNLLAEAQFYRYADDRSDSGPETPLSEHNHALDARAISSTASTPASGPEPANPGASAAIPWWLDPATEHLWTRIF